MQRFETWLLKGAGFRSFLKWLPLIVIFSIVLARTGRRMADYLFPGAMESFSYSQNAASGENFYAQVAVAVIAAPIIEEIINRALPFFCIQFFCNILNRTINGWWIAFYVVTSSVWFGYLHAGIASIFVQGLVGIVIAIVFLKISAAGAYWERGVLAAMILHASYNATLITGYLLGFL